MTILGGRVAQTITIKDPLNNVTTLTYYPTGLINTITDGQVARTIGPKTIVGAPITGGRPER